VVEHNCGPTADLNCGECGRGLGAEAAITTRGKGARTPENVRDGLQGAARGHASQLGMRLELRDQVPALSQHDAQDLGKLQAAFNSKEKHSLKVTFDDDCGDFFAGCDSLELHRRKPHVEYLSVMSEKADEKRRGPMTSSWGCWRIS
jgi:hypothetical protein